MGDHLDQAGVVLGPSILGQSTTFLSNVFPKETRIVLETTAAFGFMLFIFLIGVKVDPIMVYRTGKPLGTALAENLIALLKYLCRCFSLFPDYRRMFLP